MPSLLLTAASGAPFPIYSGNPWSGQGTPHPVGGIQLLLHPNASGNAYVFLSGNPSGVTGVMTVTSGGAFPNGSGLLDGMLVPPGGSYFIPKLGINPSGSFGVYATCDAGASGQARLFFEVF